MPGLARNLIEHSLNVDPKATPKRQHLRRFADDRRDAIKKELAKLLAAGFIREALPQGPLRVAGDRSSYRLHYELRPALLPRLLLQVHQIAIKKEDQEKNAFITPFDAYCYTTMSFGLKNAGATYQRAIQACFERWRLLHQASAEIYSS
jgi:hypothetical protein